MIASREENVFLFIFIYEKDLLRIIFSLFFSTYLM